jgi:hypothetical protein
MPRTRVEHELGVQVRRELSLPCDMHVECERRGLAARDPGPGRNPGRTDTLRSFFAAAPRFVSIFKAIASRCLRSHRRSRGSRVYLTDPTHPW